MSQGKIIFLVCLAAAMASLAIGLSLAGQWLRALAILLPVGIMLLESKFPGVGLASIALLLFIGLAANGILLNAPSFLMLCGAIFALASWDLALWGHAVQRSFSHQVQLLENKHLKSLLLVVILGGMVVGAERFLHLQIHFWVILFLVIAVFYGLDKIFGLLRAVDR